MGSVSEPSHDEALAGEAERAPLKLAERHPVLPQSRGVRQLLQVLVVRLIEPAQHARQESEAAAAAAKQFLPPTHPMRHSPDSDGSLDIIFFSQTLVQLSESTPLCWRKGAGAP